MSDGVALLVGITIGVGIFSTPGLIAEYQSSVAVVMALWALVGVFAFLGALIYAELGTRLPDTGGEYAYITRSFGPFAGFIFGWSQLLIIRTSPAAGLSLVAADYLGHFFPLTDGQKILVALGVIALLGTFNYLGVERASAFQKVSTLVKLLGILVLAVAGLAIAFSGELQPPDLAEPAPRTAHPLSAFSATMMLLVFSYLGWDRVGYVAGEMRNPKRVIPTSLLLGMGAVVVAYLSTNWFYHQTLGLEGVRGSKIVASDAAVVVFGPIGAGLVALLVIVSSMGSTNGTMMSASRVYYAMARDKLFFQWLDFVHPRFRTPTRAVLAHCIWAAVILLVRQTFETIVAGMAFAVLIFYAVTTLALFKLRREGVGGSEVFQVPLYPLLPALYLAGILSLIGLRIVFEFENSLKDMAFIASGLPFAWYWCRRK